MRNTPIHTCILLVFALLLCGCAAPPLKPNPETVKGVKRVGIISLLGEEIEAKYVGITMFGNEYYLTPAQDWALNQKTIDVASHTLKNAGFEVVNIDYDYAGMWKKYRQSQENYFTRVSETYGNDTTTPIIKEDLENLRRKYSVDGFYLIVPGHEGPYCPGGEPCIGYGNYGYGFHNRLNRSTNAYISAKIYFIPSNMLTSVSQSLANIHVTLPLDYWRKTYSVYNDKEKRLIRYRLYDAAERAIPQAINEMGLLPN